jgi:DNA-binding NarL/FixJ family response regulator
MTIKVYLVDDHALVRERAENDPARRSRHRSRGESDNGETALPSIRRLRPDVVLCDLRLPGITGGRSPSAS